YRQCGLDIRDDACRNAMPIRSSFIFLLSAPARPEIYTLSLHDALPILSQSTFSVKVLNLFSRSRRKTNKRKSKHSAMLRNKETRHRMFIGLLNTTRKLA